MRLYVCGNSNQPKEHVMAKRLIQETNLNGVKVRVMKDSEWNEYVVTVSIGGVKQDDSSYHTDDKQDAIDTASLILEQNASLFA